MKLRAAFEPPAQLRPALARARRLEWWSLGIMLLVTAAVYAVTGNSQAMKTAWVEDLLSLLVPAAYLVAAHRRHRPPEPAFPYGQHRCSGISFLIGAVCLTLFGALLLVDAAVVLLGGERPTIGTTRWADGVFWSGWLMMAVLAASAVPPVLLGRLKLRLAHELQDKTLKTDAAMNKADWQTALAGCAGILGVGLGYWWADAAAAAFIAGSVLRDGLENLREATLQLMDGSPLTLAGDPSPVPAAVQAAVAALPWVETVAVRFREEGDVLTGELFLRAREGGASPARLQAVRQAAAAVDWRVHDCVVELTGPGEVTDPPGRQPAQRP